MPPTPQAGVLARPPEHLLVVALAFATPTDPAANTTTLTRLREVLRRELAGDLDEITATTPKDAATLETGEVGVADGWDQTDLTVDLGISATGFAALGVPPGQQPGDLHEVPWASFGPNQPQDARGGDLILHIRAGNLFAVEHVLRRVEHTLTGSLATIWAVSGTQRYSATPGARRDEGRGLIGFHDGLSNLDPNDPADRALIVVDPAAVTSYPATPVSSPVPGSPGYTGQPPTTTDPTFPTTLRPAPTAEPAWTAEGSYMFVRASIFNTAQWDLATLERQEAAVGRFKSSGAFLDSEDTAANKTLPPHFASNPTNMTVPDTSHARRANPRTAADPARRILRRGYPLIVSGPQGLQRGLTFVSFSRSLSTQVEFIMAGWLFNPNFPHPGAGPDPLLTYETSVLNGGYYFVPAITDAQDPTSWALPISLG